MKALARKEQSQWERNAGQHLRMKTRTVFSCFDETVPGEAEGAYLTVLAGKHSDRSLISDWSCFTIF